MSTHLMAVVVGRPEIHHGLETAGAMNQATLGHYLRSRLTELLQRTTLVGPVFCLLVDRARIIWMVPTSSKTNAFASNLKNIIKTNLIYEI
jgi:hypothetical protein